MDQFCPCCSNDEQLAEPRPSLLLMLVRHGQSEGNKQGVIQGQSDYPLSELGVQQTQALRTHLDERGVTFDTVFSSDLSRARQTAEILTSGQPTPITEDRRLRTRRYGDFTHLMCSDVTRLVGGDIAEHSLRVQPLGGETNRQVRQRALDFLRDVCTRHLSATRSPRVLVVTHNWFIIELLSALVEISGGEAQEWDRRKIPNTGVTSLLVTETSEGRIAVTCLEEGSNEHLRGMPPEA